MATVVYLAIYAGSLCFVVGCIRRVLQYLRLPVHVRWELYPVPHEHPKRAAHGGSYFEDANWWMEKQRVHRLGEARAMFAEIFLLRSVWESNRRLWYPSFVFHIGLYCLIATCALVGAATVLSIAPSGVLVPGILAGMRNFYRLLGAAGACFVLVGAAGLLRRRLCDKSVRQYTTAGDLFNLACFIAAVGLTLLGYMSGGTSAGITNLAHGLAKFDRTVQVNTIFGAGLVLASLLVAYIPYTHMSHFIGKYFTFHAVRWDDEQNRRGSDMESRIGGVMKYRPTWSAGHIGADVDKTWPEVAAANPAQEVRK